MFQSRMHKLLALTALTLGVVMVVGMIVLLFWVKG